MKHALTLFIVTLAAAMMFSGCNNNNKNQSSMTESEPPLDTSEPVESIEEGLSDMLDGDEQDAGSESTNDEDSMDEESSSSEGPSAKTYADGTYEGSSDKAYHPPLVLEVEVNDGKIAGINFIQQDETPGVGSNAIEQLPDKIIESQSTNVDGVAGATMTSNAIKDAVDKALYDAK